MVIQQAPVLGECLSVPENVPGQLWLFQCFPFAQGRHKNLGLQARTHWSPGSDPLPRPRPSSRSDTSVARSAVSSIQKLLKDFEKFFK